MHLDGVSFAVDVGSTVPLVILFNSVPLPMPPFRRSMYSVALPVVTSLFGRMLPVGTLNCNMVVLCRL